MPLFRAARRLRASACRLLFAVLVPMLPWMPAQAAALVVDGSAALRIWPAVTVLRDPSHALDAQALLAAPQRFAVPTGTPNNFGLTADTVWLRVPLHVPGSAPAQRVLEIDYPALNEVELVLARDGRIVSRQRLGNLLRLGERPMPTRTHAALLDLPAGDSVLLLRVRTQSSMVLPMKLHTVPDFARDEARSGLMLGLCGGLGLCMLLYSLLNWLALRDRVFLDYAMLLAATGLFMANFFGVAPQMLWPDHPALSRLVSPLSVLVAVYAGTLFLRNTLSMAQDHPRTGRALRAMGLAAVAAGLIGVAGLIDYRTLQTLATLLGLSSTVIALPAGWQRARTGDRSATWVLAGWVAYMCGAAATSGMLRGLLEPTVWTQYLYPVTTILEMSAWMAVLGLRVQAIHRSADRARIEAESLRVLALTDALTGLPNRRGLRERLDLALQDCGPGRLLALYLLDLDGFKPVNDRHGHEVGDALLVAVGQRLRLGLGAHDVVARLGGDEFVVLATGLSSVADAQALGAQMLAAFERPFDALGRICEVGLTIGYAVAPLDGTEAQGLLKRADDAMYAGKQAGRRRVQRCNSAPAPAGPSDAQVGTPASESPA